MASYICTRCGEPADVESQGYIASYCDKCWGKVGKYYRGEPIEFSASYTITTFKNGERYTKTISFEDEWNRYLKLIKKNNSKIKNNLSKEV